MSEMHKVNFRIEKDEDGFPPVSIETLWAEYSDHGYMIDSIPFFTKDATNGDVISTTTDADGDLWFNSRIISSTNSLVRLVLFDGSIANEVSLELRKMGCSTEFISDYEMMAVNVPKTTPYQDVIRFIDEKGRQGLLDYEEALIRQ